MRAMIRRRFDRTGLFTNPLGSSGFCPHWLWPLDQRAQGKQVLLHMSSWFDESGPVWPFILLPPHSVESSENRSHPRFAFLFIFPFTHDSKSLIFIRPFLLPGDS